MKTHKTFLHKSTTTLTGIAAIFIAGLMFTAWPSSGRRTQDKGIAVANQTTAFQVETAVADEHNLHLKLRNVSDKAINGYTLAVGSASIIQTDYTISGFTIAPGELEERTFPLSLSTSSKEISTRIEVQAAVFSDHTYNGSITAANAIINRRLGLKTQLQAVLGMLDMTLKSPSKNLSTPLSQLESQITFLPEEQQGSSSHAFKEGLRDAKADTQSLLKRITHEHRLNNNLDLRQKLTEAKEKIAERIQRL